MLISTLAVPAVRMSAPKMKIRIGMMNSPPATPSRLEITPTSKPARTAAESRNAESCGSAADHDAP